MKHKLFQFDWSEIYNPLAKSDVFYCVGNHHNPVVNISFMGREVMIACDGRMNFFIGKQRVRTSSDLQQAGIKTDADWRKFQDSDEFAGFVHTNTPWFDAYEWNERTKEWKHLDKVYYDLDSIILDVQRHLMEKPVNQYGYILATRSIKYNLGDIYETLVEMGIHSVTEDDVIEMIKDYAIEDLSCGWGHTIDVSNITFTNEEGEEL